MSRHRRLRKRPRLLMFVVAALALITPGLVLIGSASADANHEVVCHMQGNGTAHAIPPSKTSAHYPKHFSDDPTDSDFMIYVTYPVTDDSWPTVKAAADAQCDAENPNNPDEIPVPTVPVIDECGPGNAVYGAVPAGNYTVVRNSDGSITLTALKGFVFPGGKTSVTLPAPVDSGEACPPPPPKDACDNLDGDQPEGTDCTQPEEEVQQRDVNDVNCDTDTVTIQHQERTREYSWDGDSWEPGEWSEWKTVSTDTRPATDEECPDEETPPTEAENTYEASASGCDDLLGEQPTGSIMTSFTNTDDATDNPVVQSVRVVDVLGQIVAGPYDYGSVADGDTVTHEFTGQPGGTYTTQFLDGEGKVVHEETVTVEFCELPPLEEGDASVIGKCHSFVVTNGEDVDGYLFYGDFQADGPDNAEPVLVPANGTVKVKTSRTEVDGLIFFENGKYFEFQDVKVKQDCGHKPPVPPTPPTPHGPKWPTVKGGGEVVNPTFDTGLAGSQEGTGGPHGLLYMLLAGTAGGLVLIGMRSRKFGRN